MIPCIGWTKIRNQILGIAIIAFRSNDRAECAAMHDDLQRFKHDGAESAAMHDDLPSLAFIFAALPGNMTSSIDSTLFNERKI